VILKADHASYKLHFNAFLDIAAKYSPLLEPDSLDSAYIDISGCSILGSSTEVAEAIASEVNKSLNLSVSMGYASNKLLAKIASGMGRKITCIENGAEDSFLSTISISKLDAIDHKIEKRLNDLGVSTIGQLALISEATLIRQFGPIGVIIKKQSCGIDHSPVKALYPPEIIKIERMFPFIADEPAQILERFQEIAEQASSALRKINMLAGGVALTLFDESKKIEKAASWCTTFKKPTESAYSIHETLARLLDAIMKPGMEVYKAEIVLSNLQQGQSSQLCLLGEGERKRRILQTVEIINERFGEGKVSVASSLISSSSAETFKRLVA